MKTSEQINEIAKALAKAQGEMKAPEKDKKGNFGMYSSIDAIWSAAQKVLPQCGLCVVQDLSNSDNGITIETRILHESGQWMSFGPFFLPVATKEPHKYAGSCTYARRYSLCSALCINGDVDDDAQEANKLSLTEKSGVDKSTGEVKTKSDPLTQLQKDKIMGLVNSIDDEEYLDKLCKFLNVKTLIEIRPADFDKVMLSLEKKVGE